MDLEELFGIISDIVNDWTDEVEDYRLFADIFVERSFDSFRIKTFHYRGGKYEQKSNGLVITTFIVRNLDDAWRFKMLALDLLLTCANVPKPIRL